MRVALRAIRAFFPAVAASAAGREIGGVGKQEQLVAREGLGRGEEGIE